MKNREVEKRIDRVAEPTPHPPPPTTIHAEFTANSFKLRLWNIPGCMRVDYQQITLAE